MIINSSKKEKKYPDGCNGLSGVIYSRSYDITLFIPSVRFSHREHVNFYEFYHFFVELVGYFLWLKSSTGNEGV